VDQASVEGLGLAEAIAALRDDLLKARAAGATSDIQLPVESMTVVLTVTATREVNGKAGSRRQSWRSNSVGVGAASAVPGRRSRWCSAGRWIVRGGR
jgi:Trypsin-co-occurring domain 2